MTTKGCMIHFIFGWKCIFSFSFKEFFGVTPPDNQSGVSDKVKQIRCDLILHQGLQRHPPSGDTVKSPVLGDVMKSVKV